MVLKARIFQEYVSVIHDELMIEDPAKIYS